MVAICHPLPILQGALLTLVAISWICPVTSQVGLRTLPLTASQNSSNRGLYSKWMGPKPARENEIAAIFHGVAYGVSTDATTTTTTTPPPTTTIPIFATTYYYNPVTSAPPAPSSIPVSPPKQENQDGARSVQQFYAEKTANTDIDSGSVSNEVSISSFPEEPSETSEDQIGVKGISWLTMLGVLWQVHVYTAAALFTLLVLCSLYSIARLSMVNRLLPRGYYITIHLLVFLASFFRCVLFFHDPYAVEERLPDGLSNVLFNTGMPCIIMALAMLILGILRVARLKILPLNLQSPVVVAIVSGALIMGSIVVDILGGIFKDPQLSSGLRAGMQALTAGWAAALCVGYIAIFYKVERTSKRQQDEATRLSFTRVHMDNSLSRRFPKSSLNCAGRATLVAVISGLILAVLQVYGLMNTEGILTVPPLDPWAWYAYHTACRCLEVLMWASIWFSASLPNSFTPKRREQSGVDDGQLLTVFACKSCTSCSNISTCCTTVDKKEHDDLYSSFCQTNHIARKFSFRNGRTPILQDTIATARSSPSHISTTLVSPKTKPALKATTLHAGKVDGPVFWNSHGFNSNTTSRPSSLILSESGAIRFCTIDPRQESVHIMDFKKKNPDQKAETLGVNDKVGNVTEDNYINSGCKTPSDNFNLKPYNFNNYNGNLNDQQSSELYAEIVQNQESEQTNFRSQNSQNIGMPPHLHCKSSDNNCSHLYSGYEIPPYYQESDWTPHIYASLNPVRNDSNTEGVAGNNVPFYQENFYNDRYKNSTALEKRTPQHNIQREKCGQFCSESDICSNNRYLNAANNISSSKSSNFHHWHSNDLNTSKKSPHYPINDRNLHDFTETETVSEDFTCGSPTSYSSKGLLSKIVPSTFGNGGYAPLSSEESPYPSSDSSKNIPSRAKNRPSNHRLREAKQSPTSPSRNIDSPEHFPLNDKDPRSTAVMQEAVPLPSIKSEQSKEKKESALSSFHRQYEPYYHHAQPPTNDLQHAACSFSSRPPSSMMESDLGAVSDCSETDEEGGNTSVQVRWPANAKVDF